MAIGLTYPNRKPPVPADKGVGAWIVLVLSVLADFQGRLAPGSDNLSRTVLRFTVRGAGGPDADSGLALMPLGSDRPVPETAQAARPSVPAPGLSLHLGEMILFIVVPFAQGVIDPLDLLCLFLSDLPLIDRFNKVRHHGHHLHWRHCHSLSYCSSLDILFHPILR